MDVFLEVSAGSPRSGAHCRGAGSEKLQSGGLVCSATSDLHRKSSRLCKDVLRWANAATRHGQRLLSERKRITFCESCAPLAAWHDWQRLHRASPIHQSQPEAHRSVSAAFLFTHTLRLQGTYLPQEWRKIIQKCLIELCCQPTLTPEKSSVLLRIKQWLSFFKKGLIKRSTIEQIFTFLKKLNQRGKILVNKSRILNVVNYHRLRIRIKY